MGASASSIPEKVSVCSGCHGQDGMGQPNIAPMIAGLNANYLNTQIELFLSGERQNVVMQGMAKELSDPAVRKAVMDYFANLPSYEFTNPEQRGDQADIRNPYRKLIFQGDWDRNIPACATCHGASGMGVDKFPRLASQHADYLKTQLMAWKNGTRSGDPLNMMGTIAKNLTDEEIENLSYYFASLRY
ncbi:c-type cytochrome [Vibrio parahaemolyticus]|uniref:c-type cytochrome n=1 Tax=Vibrio parahaemolyticus TaxID=670 RepID=UPI003B5A54CC